MLTVRLCAIVVVTLFLSSSERVFAVGSGGHERVQIDSIPHNVSPKNDSTLRCIPNHVQLKWTVGISFTDAYYVEISRDSNFFTPDFSQVVFHDTTYNYSVPQHDTTFYWRIRTDFDTTAIWHFNLRQPIAGTIASPLADTVTDYTVHFFWHPNPSGDRYELLIESDAFSLRDTVSSKDTSTSITLLGSKTYTWKFRPLCGDGVGMWSNSGMVYIDATQQDVAEQSGNTDGFRVYFNASASAIMVNAPQNTPMTKYSVYNLNGQPVREQWLDGVSTVRIESSSLPKGPIFLEIQSQGKIFRRMLIVD